MYYVAYANAVGVGARMMYKCYYCKKDTYSKHVVYEMHSYRGPVDVYRFCSYRCLYLWLVNERTMWIRSLEEFSEQGQ